MPDRSVRSDQVHGWCLRLTVAAVAATAILTGCSASPSAAKRAQAPSEAAAQVVLNGLAQDVLTRHSAAYAAALDPSAAAEGFRTAQDSDVANLAGVPLASWSYHLDSLSKDATSITAATKRLATPDLIAEVSLNYALRGVDLLPTHHDLWLTFTERHGKTYLAGDDDLADTGFSSWVGPWHFGPISTYRGTSSLILGPAADPGLLKVLAGEVDSAVPAVTAVWGRDWSQQVAVIVPSTPAEFSALLGSGSITDISAAASTDGIDPVTGKAYGQRLILNPTTLGDLTPVGRRIVLRHEITHLASAASTADITPRWLVEGFAEYVGNLGTGQPVTTAAQELTTLVRAGKPPETLPADTAFGSSGAALARDYEESWLACRLIADKVGAAGLVRFYRSVGTAVVPSAVALSDGLTAVLHESLATFTSQWWTYVQTQLS